MPEIGRFYWTELNTSDAARARAFYAAAMGWTYQEMTEAEGGPYWLALSGGQPVAGILPLTGSGFDGQTDFWLPYLAVADVDAKLEAALEAGASVVRPLWDVPETGRRVVIREPGGALVAWMTPAG